METNKVLYLASILWALGVVFAWVDPGSPNAAGGILVFSGVNFIFLLPYKRISRFRTTHAKIHVILCLFGMATMLVMAPIADVPATEEMQGFFVVWGLTLLASLASLLFALPSSIIPSFRVSEKTSIGGIAPSVLDEKFKSIQVSFSKFHDAIHNESNAINTMLAKVQSEIERHYEELENARDELEKARQDADYYKELANLSEDNQRLFLNLISRNKQRDYWIGLLGGLFSSTLVAVGGWLASRYFTM